jgi:tetratricopeptide (TPR) repeat protein
MTGTRLVLLLERFTASAEWRTLPGMVESSRERGQVGGFGPDHRVLRHRAQRIIALLSAVTGLASAAVAQEVPGSSAGAVLGPRREAKVFYADLSAAWRAYGRSNLEAAEPLFRRVAEAPAPPAGELCEALFGLGWCHAFRRPLPDVAGAVEIFTRVAREFSADPLAPWALIELGNLRVKKGHPRQEAGRKHYREVMEKYPESPAVHEAVLRLANSLFYEMTDPEMNEGAAVLERHLVLHPENPVAVIMHFRLDYYYGDIRLDYAACLPHAIRVADMKLSDPFRWSRQYWHVAEILRLRLGRPQEAARWYRKIVDECPTSMQALASAEILASIEKNRPASKGQQ